MAQELLTTFDDGSIAEIRLRPQFDKAGTFKITVDDECIWDRKFDSGFPQPKELKQRIRDKVDASRDLGHSDVSS